MRRLLSLSILVLAACGDPNANKLFADTRWAVRNSGGTQVFDHDANDFSGKNGISVSCNAPLMGGSRTLNMTVACAAGGCGNATNGTIEIINATFPAGATSPAAGCTMRVSEGVNTYQGGCGGSAPAPGQPCQITEVRFYTDTDTMLPTLQGNVLCTDIPNATSPSDPVLARNVTFIGPTGGAMPATFRITNCRGIMPGT